MTDEYHDKGLLPNRAGEQVRRERRSYKTKMAHGIKRDLKKAKQNVEKAISDSARSGGMYGRGLSREGYAGGYAQALQDVELALNGVTPNNSRYWPNHWNEG